MVEEYPVGIGPCAECGAACDGTLCPGCIALRAQREAEIADTKSCPRCMKATRSWTRETFRDGKEYCQECVKQAKAQWMAENSCMVCLLPVAGWEERTYPPERIQQRDPLVRNRIVKKRFVCRKCRETMNRRRFGVLVRRGGTKRTPVLRRMSRLLGVGYGRGR